MNALSKRAGRAAQSILENEGLTSELDDTAADALLDWGIACADLIERSTRDLSYFDQEEAMAPRLRAVRRLMRLVNRWASKLPKMESEEHAERLAALIEQAAIVYDDKFKPPPAERSAAFLKLVSESITPLELVSYLRGLVESSNSASSSAQEEEKEQSDDQAEGYNTEIYF